MENHFGIFAEVDVWKMCSLLSKNSSLCLLLQERRDRSLSFREDREETSEEKYFCKERNANVVRRMG